MGLELFEVHLVSIGFNLLTLLRRWIAGLLGHLLKEMDGERRPPQVAFAGLWDCFSITILYLVIGSAYSFFGLLYLHINFFLRWSSCYLSLPQVLYLRRLQKPGAPPNIFSPYIRIAILRANYTLFTSSYLFKRPSQNSRSAPEQFTRVRNTTPLYQITLSHIPPDKAPLGSHPQYFTPESRCWTLEKASFFIPMSWKGTTSSLRNTVKQLQPSKHMRASPHPHPESQVYHHSLLQLADTYPVTAYQRQPKDFPQPSVAIWSNSCLSQALVQYIQYCYSEHTPLLQNLHFRIAHSPKSPPPPPTDSIPESIHPFITPQAPPFPLTHLLSPS